MAEDSWEEILRQVDENGGVGRYVASLERSLQTGQKNLSRMQENLAALQDSEKIYSLWVNRTKVAMGDSYLLVGPDHGIREVSPRALEIMGETTQALCNKDYRHIVEENSFPKDAGIDPGEGLKIIMLDNERVIQLGPSIQYGSAVPDDNRYYGEIVRVSKGPEITIAQRLRRVARLVSKQEGSIMERMDQAKRERRSRGKNSTEQ